MPTHRSERNLQNLPNIEGWKEVYKFIEEDRKERERMNKEFTQTLKEPDTNNSRPQIINHILEDLDDQAADNLENYIDKLEDDVDFLERLIKQYRKEAQ